MIIKIKPLNTTIEFDFIQQIKKLLALLVRSEKIELSIVVVISILTSLIQSFSVISLMPFINMVMNPGMIKSNDILMKMYTIGHFQSEKSFIFFLGYAVVGIIILSNGMAAITSLFTNRFVQFRYFSLSSRLLKIYLSKPYEYYLLNNTSTLGQTLLSEVQNFINNYLKNLMNLITNLVMFIFLLVTLMMVNYQVTITIVLLFGFLYGLMNVSTRKRLVRSGNLLLQFSNERFRSAMEAFSSIKITKSLGIEDFFINRYKKASKKHAQHSLRVSLIADMPSHLVEIFAFGGIVSVILVIINRGQNVNNYMPLLSVFTLAGYRLLPVITVLYRSVTNTQHAKTILDKLYFDMITDNENPIENAPEIIQEPISFNHSVAYKNCTFKYSGSETIIDNLNLEIAKGSIIGFAGTTGAGKTTLIDIFLGLLKPEEGGLFVDDQPITENNLKAWQKKMGYVPQDIFLIDDTIRHNIAFGIPEKEIDDQKVINVCRMASIADFIETNLSERYETIVGERGVRLSGGQRQRLGLARALYRDPEILILDEATSALDGATEEKVLEGIHSGSQVRTMLIIAHRLNTLKVCDQIYLLEKGKIIDQGTYEELIQNSAQFMKMAKVE